MLHRTEATEALAAHLQMEAWVALAALLRMAAWVALAEPLRQNLNIKKSADHRTLSHLFLFFLNDE